METTYHRLGVRVGSVFQRCSSNFPAISLSRNVQRCVAVLHRVNNVPVKRAV